MSIRRLVFQFNTLKLTLTNCSMILLEKLPKSVGVVFLFMSLATVSFGTASVGTEVHYEEIDSLVYRVDFVFYRTCQAVSVSDPRDAKVICASSGQKQALSPTFRTGNFLKVFCDDLGDRCGGKLNTSRSGDGVEKLIFSDTVDFKASPFNSFITNGCTEIRFEFGGCCRPGNLNSGAGNTTYYNFATLNLGARNSTPEFTIEPPTQLLLNQPVNINLGAIDPEGDSLSYSMGTVMTKFGTSATYSGALTPQVPLGVYYPGTLKYPYSNPAANPPIGLHLDDATGQLTFTPVGKDFYGILLIEVTEWRKDPGTGKQVAIAKTRREWNVNVLAYPNHAPALVGNFNNTFCEGDKVVFDLKTKDPSYVEPPPGSTYTDTTTINWYTSLSSPTISKVDTSRELGLHMEWQTKSGDATVRPYLLYVHATDNRCGYRSHVSHAIQFNLNETPDTFSLRVDSLGCGFYRVLSSYLQKDTSRVKCEVSVRSKKNLATIHVFGGGSKSNRWNGLIDVNSNDTYYIDYKVFVNSKCFEVRSDSFVVADMAEHKINSDTTICYPVTGIDLRTWEASTSKGGTWKNITASGTVDTAGLYQPGTVTKPTRHELQYAFTNKSSNCVSVNNIEVTVLPLSAVEIEDFQVCEEYDTLLLKQHIVKRPNSSLGTYNWSCVDCGPYDFSKILIDVDSSPLKRYAFDINQISSKLGSKSGDSIIFELNYVNEYGCSNRDTATLVVGTRLSVTYDSLDELCWNAGIIDLNALSSFQGGTNQDIWLGYPGTGYGDWNILRRAMTGDTLDTRLLPNPGNGNNTKYLLRKIIRNKPCYTLVPFELTINGLPEPQIDESALQLNSSLPPYSFCETEKDIMLRANMAGGTWASYPDTLLNGSVFMPTAATSLDSTQTIYYHFVDSKGCSGSDSVLVTVYSKHEISITPDTAFTWYGTPMKTKSKAIYKGASEVTWLPLTGGTLDDMDADEVEYTFTSSRSSLFTHLLYCKTSLVNLNGCPFAEATQQIIIHPDPCMDINMDYDVASGKLTVSPTHQDIKIFRWSVGNEQSTDSIAEFDLSAYGDTTLTVSLVAINQLGDSCKSYNKINLANGNINRLALNLRLFPNPTTGILSFVLPNSIAAQSLNLNLYDQKGVLISSFSTGQNQIDVSHLATGIYSIVLPVGQNVYVGRFVKQ